MDIRNFRKRNVGKKRLATFIVVVLLVFLLVQIKNHLGSNSSQETFSGDIFSGDVANDLIVGQKINFAGTLSVDNHFPLYTHSIINGGAHIGIKSSSVNLNDYKGEIGIAGVVLEINRGLPIVDVSTVKLAKPGLIIKNNVYLFIKDLLYLDFTQQSQLSANKSGKNITVYFNKAPIFDIERFLCSKIIENKDCNNIIESYLRDQKEFFTSYRGYSFYKQGDKTWTLFDGNIFGYSFKNAEDNTLLDVSNMIRVVNKDFVINNKKDIIKEKCSDANDQAKDITFAKVGFNDPYYLVVSVEGNTKKKQSYTCDLTFDLRNEWEVTDVNFEIIQ